MIRLSEQFILRQARQDDCSENIAWNKELLFAQNTMATDNCIPIEKNFFKELKESNILLRACEVEALSPGLYWGTQEA